MIANGAIPSWFLTLAMVSSGSIAMAEGSSTKPPNRATSAPKVANPRRAASSADPFEQSSTSKKPQVSPVGAWAPPNNLPSRELEAFMKSLEGSWRCDTKFAAGAMGPGSQPMSAKTSITIRRDFGGIAWHGEFRLAKTATTRATSGVFQISYASATGQATFLSYDSLGSAMMGAGTLADDSVTFVEAGFLKGARVKIRETLTVRGTRRLYHKVEIEQGNAYHVMAEDSCSK